MALRAILQGAAARHRAACRATGPTTLAAHLAAAAPWSTPSLLGALPLGHLPTRVLSFPSQQVQVKVHVAAAFPSTAGEEGKTGRVDADKPGIRDARKPATKLDLWELKELVRSERATISTEIKRHTRLINNMIKEHSSNRQRQARSESNRQVLFTSLIAIVMEVIVLLATNTSASKKTTDEGMSVSGTGGTKVVKTSFGAEKGNATKKKAISGTKVATAVATDPADA